MNAYSAQILHPEIKWQTIQDKFVILAQCYSLPQLDENIATTLTRIIAFLSRLFFITLVTQYETRFLYFWNLALSFVSSYCKPKLFYASVV